MSNSLHQHGQKAYPTMLNYLNLSGNTTGFTVREWLRESET